MGRDKLRLEYEGETLLCRAFRRFSAEFESVYISAGGKEPRNAPSGAEIIRDILPGLGPISGLHAALARFDAVFLVAADMPLAEPGRARAVIEAMGNRPAAAAARGGEPEPLFAAYSRAILPEAGRAIEAGDYSLRRLLARAGARYVETPPETLLNINLPEDYERLVRPITPCRRSRGR
jgi:molybdopterin-guanine dinucleotide biosynthesis protein A